MISLFKKIAIIATFIFIASVLGALTFQILREWGIYDAKPVFSTFQELAIANGLIALGTGLAALTLMRIEGKR